MHPSVGQHDRHLNFATCSQHFERYFLAVTTDLQVDARRAELQVAQDHLIEKLRQARITKSDLAARGIEFQTEGCLQQTERRRTRPGLRSTRHRVKHRSTPPFALKPAE